MRLQASLGLSVVAAAFVLQAASQTIVSTFDVSGLPSCVVISLDMCPSHCSSF
jgi:hypothetical protein